MANHPGIAGRYVTASWWVLGGFLVCAASTVFLPDREAVHEHARAQAELLDA